MSDTRDRTAQLSAWLSQDIVERLKKSARKNKRTIRAELEIAIGEHLDRQSSEPELPAELQRAVEDYLQRHGQR